MIAPPPKDESPTAVRSRLRAGFRSQRQALSDATIKQHGSAIATHWLAAKPLRSFAPGSIIALFLSQDGEPDTQPLLRALSAAGYRLALPVLAKGRSSMAFAPYDLGAPLVRGRYDIMQPAATVPTLQPGEIALVAVPLVAYDAAGTRLGMGGGYYDRWCSEADATAPRIGIAHAQQCSAEPLPRANWDVPLDAVVTERGVTLFQPKRLAGPSARLR